MGSITLEGMPAHTSYSAFHSYVTCPNQFYLERVVHVPTIPNWAMLGGSAVHKATEHFDLEHPMSSFEDYLEEQIQDQQRRRPDVRPGQYRATGKASKEWPDKKDKKWWLVNGPHMVQGYMNWRTDTDWPIWVTPEGEPGVELALDFQLPDGPTVKGYIDRVFEPTRGNLVIVDLKTGNPPMDSMQNGIYATGLEVTRGVRPRWGSIWSPTLNMSHSEPNLLDRWSPGLLAELFNQFCAGVNEGLFLPKVSRMCSGCGVNKFCTVYGGDTPNDTFAKAAKDSIPF